MKLLTWLIISCICMIQFHCLSAEDTVDSIPANTTYNSEHCKEDCETYASRLRWLDMNLKRAKNELIYVLRNKVLRTSNDLLGKGKIVLDEPRKIQLEIETLTKERYEICIQLKICKSKQIISKQPITTSGSPPSSRIVYKKFEKIKKSKTGDKDKKKHVAKFHPTTQNKASNENKATKTKNFLQDDLLREPIYDREEKHTQSTNTMKVQLTTSHEDTQKTTSQLINLITSQKTISSFQPISDKQRTTNINNLKPEPTTERTININNLMPEPTTTSSEIFEPILEVTEKTVISENTKRTTETKNLVKRPTLTDSTTFQPILELTEDKEIDDGLKISDDKGTEIIGQTTKTIEKKTRRQPEPPMQRQDTTTPEDDKTTKKPDGNDTDSSDDDSPFPWPYWWGWWGYAWGWGWPWYFFW